MTKKPGAIIPLLLLMLAVPLHADEIHDAVQKGDLAAVKNLVEQDAASANSRDESGRTPLHWACRGRSLELVAYLVEKGADVNAMDNNQIAPLHSLAARNLTKAAELLIEKGAAVSVEDYDKQTPLHHSASSNHIEVSALLVKRGAKLEIKDNWGRTPLLLCARERGGPELAKILIEGGAEVNVRDKFGSTSLNLAAWRGKSGVVDVLLEAGADVPTEGRASRTLMMFATAHGLENLFDRLEEGGADTAFTLGNGGSLLHEAAGGGSIHIMKKLRENGLDANRKNQFGWTPLHYAAKNGRRAAAEFLIRGGADINTRSVMGQSAFNVAEEFKQAEIAMLLSEKKADKGPLRFPRLEGDYLGQKPPGDKPEVFGLGIVSSIWGLHSSVVFSPDGDTALWVPMVLRPGAIYSTGIIYMMTREDGRWTAPQTAPFSGAYDDDVPFFAPDGRKLYFNSARPLPDVPRSQKERIWVMDKTANGWSDPKPLDDTVNDMQMHWQFSVDGEGHLYFSSRSPDGFGGGDIYRARYEDGRYLKPENCGAAVNSDQGESTPFIAPDGSYLIFARNQNFFICFRNPEGVWTQAVTMGKEFSTPFHELCPIVTADGRYLFFVTSRTGENQAFWVDAGIIERMRQDILK